MPSFSDKISTDHSKVNCKERKFNRLKTITTHALSHLPDNVKGDYIMSLNRIIAGCLMLIMTSLIGDDLPGRLWAVPILIWVGCSLTLLMFLRLAPQLSVLRRSIAIALDVAGTTIMLSAGGETTAFLYVVYLWIIIGNGFRFGGGYIFAASLASITGFSFLIFNESFWRDHLSLSLGLMSGLVILPAYSFALIRQLAKARKQAERADHAKSLFLASISHELRTPLNAIIGTAELLQGTLLDADQIKMVATINSAADGQLSLVQDVLEYSRIEVGHGRIDETMFDLTELFCTVRDVSSVEACKKGLLINTYITARTPIQLRGDERHLREVLLNLCSNAIKFTSAGSVTLAADGIYIEDELVQLRLEVVDTGIGIALDAQKHLFDLFTQADSTILDRFGGTGLGLALCDRQIRLMGGSIGVESAPDIGSTFWIDLRLARGLACDLKLPAVEILVVSTDNDWTRFMLQRLAEIDISTPVKTSLAFVQEGSNALIPQNLDGLIEVAYDVVPGLPRHAVRERFATTVYQHSTIEELRSAVQIAVAQSVRTTLSAHMPDLEELTAPSAGLAGLRVLVADDNKINRSIVSKMLESRSIQVIFAVDGEQALTTLTGGEVDIGIIDVNMPIMNGIEVAEIYTMSAIGVKRIPLIALTADANPETRARCLKAGMDTCLIKPVRTVDLVKALEKSFTGLLPDDIVSFESQEEVLPILNIEILSSLEKLGGIVFLRQIIEDFKLDGETVLEEMEAAYLERDVHCFRSEAHRLCSMGANVGARALRALCTPWESLAESVFKRDGPILLTKLQQEWRRTCVEFDLYAASEHGRPADTLNKV